MRKFAAILLLGILLFNWAGYRLLNDVMQKNATHSLEARLDRQQYDENQLITLRVPVTHLSYFNVSTSFEQTSGTIEIDGIPYQYVRRRIFNDSLEVQCIPNQTAFQLRQLGRNYFRLVNDIEQGAKPNSHPHTFKSFSTDPFTCIRTIHLDDPGFVVIPEVFYFHVSLPSLTLPTAERPPARITA